jgi:hypothetical protein
MRNIEILIHICDKSGSVLYTKVLYRGIEEKVAKGVFDAASNVLEIISKYGKAATILSFILAWYYPDLQEVLLVNRHE